MDVINAMSAILGDFAVLMALFIFMMMAAGMYGRLIGGYQALNLATFLAAYVPIGVIAAAIGKQFAETGSPILIGLTSAAFMLLAYILGSVIALRLNQTVPQSGLITANNDDPVDLDLLWETPRWYDEKGNQPYR